MDLQTARATVNGGMKDGVVCPCCDQFVKLYSRKINSSMACALIFIYRYFKHPISPWLHVPSYLTTLPLRPRFQCAIRGDWAKLKFWELIEPQPGARDDGSTRNGYWRITQRGRHFVEMRIKLPKLALVFNRNLYGFDGPQITITDALTDKFSYSELMAI